MFIAEDMEKFCDLAEHILKRAEHEHIFCSAVLLASWRRRFRACMKEVEDSVGESEVFKVEQTPLFFSREHNN